MPRKVTWRLIPSIGVAVPVSVTLSVTMALAAVSVTNRDDKDVKITVVEGSAKQDHVLKPSQAVKDICNAGCIIRLNDSENDEYVLEGIEDVSIEAGNLYYDGPDASQKPVPGGAGGPSPAKRP